MTPDIDRTHHLECEAFADAFRSLLESVLPDTTTAVVHLDEAEMDMEPDGDDCRRTWDDVGHRFERVPDEDRNGTLAWHCPTTTEPGREALLALVDLTAGIAGRHFVFRLELRNEGTPVLDAIPHHADAAVDATLLEGGPRTGEIVGLEGHDACLVPAETRLEWTAEDRNWSLRGGSLCLETLDGRRTSCYGLTGLQRATIDDDGTVLSLAWNPGEFPDDAVGTLLSWLTDRLYTPPPAIPCGTPERAREVHAYVTALLEAYDGRDL
ncbi:hypothetical protein [Halopiger djelfimassiliensis]|uniref:hypothetical protein n=1 Tax=Halopiger djelfimassiliensis TaxID=1293047 RepID=UPI000677FDB6|nr:hypothetical protein [Halopiger djelfimassiliensis]